MLVVKQNYWLYFIIIYYASSAEAVSVCLYCCCGRRGPAAYKLPAWDK